MTPYLYTLEDELNKIVKDKFTGARRPGYITVKGTFFPETYEHFANNIENFDVQESDVWVCTFPKCGTTWTQEMVWCICNNMDFEGAKVHLDKRFPFLEFSTLFDFFITAEEKEKLNVVNSISMTRTMPSPRFIKTHLPFKLLPKQLRTGVKKPRIIYVTRNPKDACISYYHHTKLIEGYKGSFDEFCRLFLGGKVPFGPYWDHVIEFWERKDERNILFLTYEEMKADLPSLLRKVSNFLKKTSYTDEQFEKLAEHLSFAKMKNNPAVNLSHLIDHLRQYNHIIEDGSFIRTGQVNQWKDKMSQEAIEEFDKMTTEKFGAVNLTFSTK